MVTPISRAESIKLSRSKPDVNDVDVRTNVDPLHEHRSSIHGTCFHLGALSVYLKTAYKQEDGYFMMVSFLFIKITGMNGANENMPGCSAANGQQQITLRNILYRKAVT